MLQKKISEFTHLNDAVSTIGTQECELQISNDTYTNAPCEVPDNIYLKFLPGYKINTYNNLLTIHNVFEAPYDKQIFDSDDITQGIIQFIKGDYIRPEWFGAKPKEGLNSERALQMAIYSACYPNATTSAGFNQKLQSIMLGAGDYMANKLKAQPWLNAGTVNIFGIGNNSVLRKFDLNNTDPLLDLDLDNQQTGVTQWNGTLSNFVIQGHTPFSGNKVNSIGLKANKIACGEFNNITIKQFNQGLVGRNSLCMTLNNCVITENNTNVDVRRSPTVSTPWSNLWTFNDCHIIDSYHWGVNFDEGSGLIFNGGRLEHNGISGQGGGLYLGSKRDAETNPDLGYFIMRGTWMEGNIGYSIKAENPITSAGGGGDTLQGDRITLDTVTFNDSATCWINGSKSVLASNCRFSNLYLGAGVQKYTSIASEVSGTFTNNAVNSNFY